MSNTLICFTQSAVFGELFIWLRAEKKSGQEVKKKRVSAIYTFQAPVETSNSVSKQINKH